MKWVVVIFDCRTSLSHFIFFSSVKCFPIELSCLLCEVRVFKNNIHFNNHIIRTHVPYTLIQLNGGFTTSRLPFFRIRYIYIAPSFLTFLGKKVFIIIRTITQFLECMTKEEKKNTTKCDCLITFWSKCVDNYCVW